MPLPISVRLAATVVLVSGVATASAADVGAILPADTDLILTLNVRQFLDDHKDTELVRRYLEPWRLALHGDEARLKTYYRDHDIARTEGIAESEFLYRARMFKSVNDALGIDLLHDLHRITCGFKIGDRRSLVFVVEGRFKPERFPEAVKQLATEHAGSFRHLKAGDHDVWQVPDNADGAYLALLDDRTLVLTASKDGMDGVLARFAGKKKDGLSAGLRTLLAGCEKEHVGLMLNHADTFANDAARFLEQEVVKGLDPGDTVTRLALGQAEGLIRHYGSDFSSLSLAISLGTEETRLQFGAETRKAERATELGQLAQTGNLAGALALKVVNDDLARQLADILLRVRVAVKEGTVILRAEVPHDFVKALAKSRWLDPAMLSNPVVDMATRRVTSVRLWKPPQPEAPDALPVDVVRDVAYYDGPDASPGRHRLDLYLPRGKKDFPVLMLVHGGSWTIGDNRCSGLYESVGHFLASRGIGAVLPNYRLSPGVKHPEHIKDVARAFAWTHKNIGKYGGNPGRLYVAGHSAGAHLVALLATDESYLRAEGLKTADIKGVIAVSGVYRVRHGDEVGTLGGTGTVALRPEQFYPIRGASVPLPDVPLPGVPQQWNVFGPAFGDDPKVRDLASPVTHVRPGLPPFLILLADHDLPTLAANADEFQKALRREGCDARLVTVEKRNHNSIMFSAIAPEDPVARAIVEFVKK